MSFSEELENFLTLYLVKGIGSVFLQKYWEVFKTFKGDISKNLHRLLPKKKAQVLEKLINSPQHRKEVFKLIELLKKERIKVFPFFSEEYKCLLGKDVETLFNKALGPALFVKGDWKKANKGFVIVGTRRATDYGKEKAFKFAHSLVKNLGLTIISGGAVGIDQSAHRGALSVNGPTGVILGEGLLEALKTKREFLTEVEQKGGFILSHFPPLAKGSKWTFPERNKILALLARLGCLIVEAPKKNNSQKGSGALITADYCNRLGRKIFVHIGFAPHPNYRGNIELLEMGLAKFVASEEELIALLENQILESKKYSTPLEGNKNSSPEGFLISLLKEKPRTFDELIYLTQLSEEQITELITTLLLEGKITEAGGYYQIL